MKVWRGGGGPLRGPGWKNIEEGGKGQKEKRKPQ